jgi:hypothetical protein
MEPYKDEYYYEASREQIEDLWSSVSGKPISLYINNPFCASICRYCAYKGTPYSSKNYNEFYHSILPSRIKLFNETIEHNHPKVLFMGGGTPSIISANDLEKILGSIKKLDQFQLKVFEVHPALHKSKHLDVLQKYGFDVVLIGVQTLNQQTLEKQNRSKYTFDEVNGIIQDSVSRGFTVGADLLVFLEPDVESSISQFRSDLSTLMSTNLHWLTIANNYYNKSTDNVLSLLNEVERLLKQSEFRFEHNTLSHSERGMYMKSHRAIRIARIQGAEKTIRQMFLVNEALHDTTHHQLYNTSEYYLIGIGNWRYTIYNNTLSVYFSPERQIEYLEVRGENGPKYFVTYDTSSKIARKDFLKKLFDLLPPPDGEAKLRVDTRILPVPGKIYRKSNVCFLTFSNADQYKKMIDVKALEELSDKYDIRIEFRFE